MRQLLTLGSLFDGSGGFPLAGIENGIVPIWASEIEPYPIAVTKSRFPFMQHLGNVMQIDGGKIPPVDVITFGSPCQDMSVAGKRAGMQHTDKGDETITRSGLFYEAIRIIQEMRGATNGKYPTFAVWENVPGAFSSNKGEDFRCVLQELAQVARGDATIPQPKGGKWNNAGEIVGDGFSIAWRVLDAQYWGVPQRRKRIYLVADFGGERAGKILFKRESLPGNPQPREEAREEAAGNAGGSIAGSGQPCADGYSLDVNCLNPWDSQSIWQYDATGIYPAVTSTTSSGQNRQGIVYAVEGNTVDRSSSKNGKGYCEDVSPTMNTQDRHAVVYDTTQITSPLNYSNPKDGDPCHPLAAQQHPPLAVYGVDCRHGVLDKDKTATLQAHANGGYSLNCTHPVLFENEKAMAFHLQQDPICGEISPCIGGQHQASVGVFMGGQGATAGGIAWSERVAPTLKSTMSGSNTIPDIVQEVEGENL